MLNFQILGYILYGNVSLEKAPIVEFLSTFANPCQECPPRENENKNKRKIKIEQEGTKIHQYSRNKTTFFADMVFVYKKSYLGGHYLSFILSPSGGNSFF